MQFHKISGKHQRSRYKSTCGRYEIFKTLTNWVVYYDGDQDHNFDWKLGSYRTRKEAFQAASDHLKSEPCLLRIGHLTLVHSA